MGSLLDLAMTAAAAVQTRPPVATEAQALSPMSPSVPAQKDTPRGATVEHGEVLRVRPDASAEPIPETPKHEPSEAEAAELRALVRACGEYFGFSEEEHREALAAALADSEAAVRSFRAIAAEHRITLDDRRRCTDCVNLTTPGRCLAAWRGEIAASRSYEPIQDLPRRCEGFKPKPEDTDQRGGRERWTLRC